jgi:predicted tellurium resistance membrane protein TerC
MELSTKQKIRFLLRGSITLASYGVAITFLFHNHELLLSLTAVFIFFIGFHFFYIELYKFNWKYLAGALLLGIIIT